MGPGRLRITAGRPYTAGPMITDPEPEPSLFGGADSDEMAPTNGVPGGAGGGDDDFLDGPPPDAPWMAPLGDSRAPEGASAERIANLLEGLNDEQRLAAEHGDTLTEDLCIARGQTHEKFAWFLRAHLA